MKYLFDYMEMQIARLQCHGQWRTAETYRATLNSFRRFRNEADLDLAGMDFRLLSDYEYHLKSGGLSPNTVSFYLKRLRAVYNRAVEEGLVADSKPFRKVFTSTEKTVKRAIPLRYIRKLKDLDLRRSPSRRFARDMFLFSFYTRGMSFVDIAWLQKKDVKDNVLAYRRRKTGQQLLIGWEPCMERIVSGHATPADSPYLFPIIKDPETDVRRQCHSALTKVNRHLKVLGRIIGLSTPLTMYVARHSWASIAREEGIPLSVISEGMGHESERTTRIYLASLEKQVVDRANRKILAKL